MTLFLQIFGGGCYLLNKILFAVAETQPVKLKRSLLIAAWTVYVWGVPAWVIILAGQGNWIAVSVQVGVVPSMLFGLYNVWRRVTEPSRRAGRFVSVFTYTALALGLGYSVVERRGITSATQVMEMGVMVGFLVGSFLLAKRRLAGWGFFMLMNVSMASLMMVQHKPILAVQQVASLGFVVFGWALARRNAGRAVGARPEPT